jgi:hypothetical protein
MTGCLREAELVISAEDRFQPDGLMGFPRPRRAKEVSIHEAQKPE